MLVFFNLNFSIFWRLVLIEMIHLRITMAIKLIAGSRLIGVSSIYHQLKDLNPLSDKYPHKQSPSEILIFKILVFSFCWFIKNWMKFSFWKIRAYRNDIFSLINAVQKTKTLNEKYPNTEFFLLRIFPHSDWIRRDTISSYSVRIRENTDQKKLRIWTLFKQCES